MSIISGFYSPRLVCLRPVLRRWIRINREIVSNWRDWKDVPWWYNERAAVSVFAGATWQADGIAFEEYTDSKRLKLKRSGRRSEGYNGRVDLYFEINQNYFIGEAKFCWVGASLRTDRQAKYVTQFLDRAKADVRKLRPYGQRRLAVVFATPFVSLNYRDHLVERVSYFIDQVKGIDVDCAAWVFPSIEASVSFRKQIYPGTAVLIKEVKR